jgi:MYXO-CTERM domain-containing protein
MQSRITSVAAAFFGVSLAAAACAPATDTDEPREHSGAVASAVIGGVASTYAQNAVVLLEHRGEQDPYSCTATLVAPNLVLTARHCVSATSESGIRCGFDGTSIENGTVGDDVLAPDLFFYAGLDGRKKSYADAPPDAIGKQIVHDASPVLCNSDLAFVVLDRSIPGRFAPLRVASGVVPPEKLTLVGWGLEASGLLPKMRVQRSGIAITRFGPTRYVPTETDGLGDSEFRTGEALCGGDSGGPMFSTQGAVVGVVSRGGGGNISPTNDATTCIGANAAGILTHLAKKQALIAQAFAAAGATLRTENDHPKKKVGATCTQSFDCISDACVDGHCRVACGDPSCTTSDDCTTFEDRKVCTPSSTPRPAATLPTAPVTPAGAPPTNNSGGCSASGADHRSGHYAFFASLGLAALAVARRRRLYGRALEGETPRRFADARAFCTDYVARSTREIRDTGGWAHLKPKIPACRETTQSRTGSWSRSWAACRRGPTRARAPMPARRSGCSSAAWLRAAPDRRSRVVDGFPMPARPRSASSAGAGTTGRRGSASPGTGARRSSCLPPCRQGG